VDGDELTVLSVTEHTRLYSGDCYIVQYTFPGKGRDETLFYAWLGCKCAAVDVLPVKQYLFTLDCFLLLSFGEVAASDIILGFKI
jgi:hypothetical protein